MRIDAALRWVTAAVIVVVGVASTIPYMVDLRINEVIRELGDLAKRERYYTSLLGLLADAETGQRGYVITGEATYLQPYEAALGMFPPLRAQIREHPRNTEEASSFGQIEAAIDVKLAELARTVALRREAGFDAAHAVVIQGGGKAQMDLLRSLVGEQISDYRGLRDELREQLLTNSHVASRISIGAGIANILALSAVLVTAHITARKRRVAEAAAKAAGDALELRSIESQKRNEQLSGSAQLMNALDMAQTLDESSEIISAYLSWLLPETAGTLYLYRNSRDLLERKASWGDELHEPDGLEPSDCWGLRSGKAHYSPGAQGLHCAHVAKSTISSPRMCLSLVSQGEVIGCLSVSGTVLEAEAGRIDREWVERLAEQLSMSLCNVQLRLSLRRQSVVDPLTELYNRRFMDETLKRELARAERHQRPIAVVLIDLDHFKHVNDDYGHEAGDGLLREVGRLLRENVRRGDIACRYGGEEMVLILPECDLSNAVRRAEQVREAIESLVFSHHGRRVPATASFGVATSDDVGFTLPEQLLSAADKALYHAKRTGRNRVACFSELPDVDIQDAQPGRAPGLQIVPKN